MFKKIQSLWRILGPGLVTGASDDDPSGIATYSQAGAKFGFQTLWSSWATLPLMIAVLEMFARLSLKTGKGLGENIRLHYSKTFLYFVIAISLPAIIFNIAANLAGMGAVANLLFPYIPNLFFAAVFTILLIVCLVFFSYVKIAAILKWLCLVLLVYFIVPFLVKQDWKAVAWATVVPRVEWSWDYFYILVAIIGTTISPYLFFWQSAMSLEHKNHKEVIPQVKIEMREMKLDISVGMLMSNLVMFFIILTTGSVLFPEGVTQIETAEQAAAALKPLAGDWAELMFALGVIGTGFLSIPVLAGAISYLISETFGWEGSIDKKWYEAKRFYGVMAGSILVGLLLCFFHIDPVQSLIYTAVAYGLTCPFLIGVVLHICNKKVVLGDQVNGWMSNIFGILALVLTAGAALSLIAMTFIPES